MKLCGPLGGARPADPFSWGGAKPVNCSQCLLCLRFGLLLVDSGGTVVLVSQDGIQRPPLRFPKGGHLLQFLSCLENGLLPHGQLDPPLWSQRGKVSSTGL